jgi:hypothetical protein
VEKTVTGLLLIVVFLIWIMICAALSRKITTNIKSRIKKTTGRLIVFLILLLAPLSDELVGLFQFKSLCKQYATVSVDEQNAVNRQARVERRDRDTYAKGTALKIRIDPYVYRDIETNKVIVRYNILQAKGGWLIRLLGISETNAPLLFEPNCEPADVYAFKNKYNIKVVN